MQRRRAAARRMPGFGRTGGQVRIAFDQTLTTLITILAGKRGIIERRVACRFGRGERQDKCQRKWGHAHEGKRTSPRNESKAMTGKMFCFGLGYSARVLARRLHRDGWRIAGTARTPEKIAELSQDGFSGHLFSGGDMAQDLLADLETADCVLISTPPGDAGDPVLAGASESFRALASRWRWLGYLSTTGVYGDRSGEWVDEETPPEPTSARAARRLAAEIAWQCFAGETGAPLHIFRLPGIYGPGRNPLEQLRAGTARRFDKPGQVFSRIHVDDLASVLAASMAQPSPGAIYNVCDDEPAPQTDVIAYGATLLGMPPPPLEPFAEAEATLSEMAKSFYRDSKRVRNDRMKRELGVRLAYPTYREGLASLL